MSTVASARPRPASSDPRLAKVLQRKRRQIRNARMNILETQDRITKTRSVQTANVDARLTSKRLQSFQQMFEMTKAPDRRSRPPDRVLPARNYTAIDNDIWGQDEIRGWFTKFAVPVQPDGMDALGSGYTVRANDGGSRASVGLPPEAAIGERTPAEQWREEHGLEADVWNRTRPRYQLRSEPAGFQTSVIRRKSRPEQQEAARKEVSVFNFSANIAASERQARERMNDTSFMPPPVKGHVAGFREAPWKDRLGQEEDKNYVSWDDLRREERERTRGKAVFAAAAENRELTRCRRRTMEAGSLSLG